MRINEFGIQVGIGERFDYRPDDEIDDVLRDVNADEGADANSVKRIDNSLAKLTEVLEKSHRACGFFRQGSDLRIGFGLGHGFKPVAGGHGEFLGNL